MFEKIFLTGAATFSIVALVAALRPLLKKDQSPEMFDYIGKVSCTAMLIFLGASLISHIWGL
jgi:hypothetical protein